MGAPVAAAAAAAAAVLVVVVLVVAARRRGAARAAAGPRHRAAARRVVGPWRATGPRRALVLAPRRAGRAAAQCGRVRLAALALRCLRLLRVTRNLSTGIQGFRSSRSRGLKAWQDKFSTAVMKSSACTRGMQTQPPRLPISGICSLHTRCILPEVRCASGGPHPMAGPRAQAPAALRSTHWLRASCRLTADTGSPTQAHQPRSLARAVGVGNLLQRRLAFALTLRLIRRALRGLLLRPPLRLRMCRFRVRVSRAPWRSRSCWASLAARCAACSSAGRSVCSRAFHRIHHRCTGNPVLVKRALLLGLDGVFTPTAGLICAMLPRMGARSMH